MVERERNGANERFEEGNGCAAGFVDAAFCEDGEVPMEVESLSDDV